MSTGTTRLDELSPEKRKLLALRLKSRKADDTSAPAASARDGGEYPLSFTQQRLWFIDQLDPGSPAYVMPFALRMRGALHVPALERALAEVVRRHQSLRTRFPEVNGEPVQRIEPADAFSLPVDDLTALTTPEREAEIARRVAAWGVLPFDLRRGPLFRVRLLRGAKDEHVFLGAMHHIVSDGWSIGVFWRELVELYRAFAAGAPSPLPPLPIQYADFAVWQRSWLAGERLERQVAWWRDHLGGAPALLELPADRPRPAVQSYRGAGHSFSIPTQAAEPVRALARREGATPFMALLAAFTLLLSRWSGQDDVVVGTPVAGRTRRETEELIGLFINTLPVRTDLSGDPSFTELVGRVREAALGAFAHQDVPFERLVEELQPGRTLSHAPIYQVMLVVQNTPEGPAEGFDGLVLEDAAGDVGAAKVDLALNLADAPDGSLYGMAEYAADLFDAATMERLARQLTALLRDAARRPHAPVSSLSMMADAERAEVLSLGAGDPLEHAGLPVHRAFAAQAARTPDAVALVHGGGTMTYGELDARSNQLARRLRRLGVGPEVRVGLHLARGPEMVVAILGVLKAGGAYVPLDPAYPAERLSYMLADAGAAVLVTRDRARDALAVPAGVAILGVDGAGAEIAAEPADAVDSLALPDTLAYVLYTSGSTGRPKGVAVPHAGVSAYLAWAGRTYPGHGSAVHSSLSFDLTVTSLFVPLLNGGAVDLVDEADPVEELARRVEGDAPLGMLKLTPTHLRALGDRMDAAAGGGGAECLVVGGEALLGEHLEAWSRRFPETVIVNEYGPTETVVGCCIDVRRAGQAGAGRVPIGRAAPNVRLYVLDAAGRPVPVGVPGELYIGGAQVARGYLGRPALTAARFVPDPFGGEPGARLYRTGDRVRWTEATDARTQARTHALDYLGRLDEQVKVRGFRIELGEIEGVLLQHPAVTGTAVVVREDVPGDPRLVAYVVGDADADTLRAHLRRTLPEYMVPAAFVALDALPLTVNGKLDRRALPAPEYARAGAEYVAPRTPTQELLAAAWAELLGVERVGAADGFFDLGGHSLLATRVVSRVRQDLGVEVPVRALFEHPALEAFAAEVDRLLRAGGAGAPVLVPAEREGDLPLSFAQERLWFVDRLEPGSPVYHMPFQYLLRGPLHVEALHRAFDEIVRRHETLRTSLPFTGDQPVQRVAPPSSIDLPLHDLSHLPEAEREAQAERVMHDAATRAFDLERGPLLRVALIRLAGDEHVLTVNLHHVISDGWSFSVLWNELSALYGAFVRGDGSPLPGLPVQYGDFAVWQRRWLSGDVLEAQLDYWRRKLAGAPPLLELPTDRTRPAVQTYAGAAETLVIGGEDAQAVLALGRREGATLFMVLLAAVNVLFSRLSGQDDVVIGTPIAGRTRRETEGLIGLFLNSLALRTDLGGGPTFRELLRRVRETTLEAYAHQDLPFERILEELAPERSLSHSPLFQVMLNLQNFSDGEMSLAGLEVEHLGVGGELSSKFDLTLYTGESPEGIVLHLVYNVALFDAERVRSMLAQLASVLRQVSDDAGRPIHAYTLLTDDARAVLPDPAAPLSAAWRGSVPRIFAAHAARTPDAVAVEDPRERWTYAELDAASDAIAHRLMEDGVRPGDVVAILGHRGAALVRALVGTLKAGAAFLILDPAYPPSRLAEYVRIARPTGFLPLTAAGPCPPEVAGALAETVLSTLPLAPREVVKVAESAPEPDAGRSASEVQPPPGVLGEVASLGEPEGAPRTELPEIGPDSLAYLSFTSGTTGRPKAVMGRHGSLTHFVPWLAEAFELGAADRFSLMSGLAHDPLHRDVFTPLQLGAAVVAPDPDEVGAAGYLARWMRDAAITVAHLTPAMGQLLVDVPGGLTDDWRVDSLRRAFFVGDVLTRTDVERMHRLAPNLRVINYYGSTETQRAVAYFPVPRDLSALAKETIPVGVGIPDVQVLIRNAAGERTGVGEVGEIWMRSPHIALGYLGDPGLTAARFVPNPWTGDPADPAYRTGDLGRYRPDGVAEIAGRADQQVKIRGFRIEPGEIEAALRAHPAVRDAVVVARGEGDGKRLAAYVVADGEPAKTQFREWLRARVPDYMVPAAWMFLSALPVTPNGKVNRAALPEPEGRGAAEAAFVPPRTPMEWALAGIWSGLLNADRVGAHDDFFALGGHSLLATKLVARVRDAFRVELPLRALFESPTLSALAAVVDRLLRAEGAAAAPPITPRGHDGTAPASFAQERLWFVDRLDGGGPVYHIPNAQLLSGPVDVEAMRRAVETVVHRHETLRTAMPEVDGAPVQRISPPRRFDLPFVDLSRLAEAERDAEATRLAERSANDPFDLEAGPLFRASLVRLAPGEHLLLVNLHHVIADGWSMRVLLDEVSALHAAYRRGDESPLAPLPVQYADYAAWQREWLSGPVLGAQLAYWRGKLAGAPPVLDLPTDRPRPPVQGHRGASVEARLGPDDAARVAELARGEGATVFMVLLAALDVVLARWSGQEEVVVGTPVAGRTRSELEGLIGLFLNSLALRADLSGDPSFRALLGRVRETTVQAYAHQDVPFERVLEEVRPGRSLAHTPVFQVMLNLLNYRDGSPAGAEGQMTSLGAGAQVASKFDLTLYAGETPEGIALHAVYDADLFDAARMRSLLAQVAAVLRQAVDDPDRPLAALSLHTEDDPAHADALEVRTARGAPAGLGEVGEVWAARDGAPAPTGQLGRLRPDGTVEVLGGADEWRARRLSSSAPRAADAEPSYLPPETEAEHAMAELWREVLGGERIGMADDFFELGGHSLLGVRLLARVRQRFGRVIPLGELFRSPTPRALAAAAVAGVDAGAGGNLVPIHPEGTLPPFFCVHPAGGTVFHYAEMARHLAPHQPFYGLQATGVQGEAEPLQTVEAMAAQYLAEVRRVQPHGPYFLGGWSAGGILALEMADRLRAAGEEVATVALMDTRTPDFHQVRRVMSQVDLYRDYAASLVSADAAALDALEAELRAAPEARRLDTLSAWMEAHGAGMERAELQRIGGAVRVFHATASSTREYRVRPYGGRVDLFCALEGTAGEGMEAAAIPEKWRALGVTELAVHPVPGTHTSMVQPPQVERLAAALRDALAEARGALAR